MSDEMQRFAGEEGERVLWVGRPDPGRIFNRRDVFWIPFSVVWVAFVVGWVAVMSTRLPLWVSLAVGSPFILFGAYALAGRFVVKNLAARRTRYTLTDCRAIVTGHRTRAVSLDDRVAHAWSTGRGSHLDVVFRKGTTALKALRLSIYEPYRNTGLDTFLRQAEWMSGVEPSLGFHDVADVAGLRAALTERFPNVTTRSLA